MCARLELFVDLFPMNAHSPYNTRTNVQKLMIIFFEKCVHRNTHTRTSRIEYIVMCYKHIIAMKILEKICTHTAFTATLKQISLACCHYCYSSTFPFLAIYVLNIVYNNYRNSHELWKINKIQWRRENNDNILYIVLSAMDSVCNTKKI